VHWSLGRHNGEAARVAALLRAVLRAAS
jgi:hypothetical protein